MWSSFSDVSTRPERALPILCALACGPGHAAGVGRSSAGWAPGGRGDGDPDLSGPDLLDRWFESAERRRRCSTDAIMAPWPTLRCRTAYVRSPTHGRDHGNAACGATSAAAFAASPACRGRARAGAESRCASEVPAYWCRDGAAWGGALASGEEYSYPPSGHQRRARLRSSCGWSIPARSRGLRGAVEAVSPFTRAPRSDQRGAERAAELPDVAGHGARSTTPGRSHLPTRTTRAAALLRRQVLAPSTRPVRECTIPSVVYPACAPGRHLMSSSGSTRRTATRGPLGRPREPFATAASMLADTLPTSSARSGRQVDTRSSRAVSTDRWQHLPGRDDPEPALRVRRSGWVRYRKPYAGCTCAGRRRTRVGRDGDAGLNAARKILGGVKASGSVQAYESPSTTCRALVLPGRARGRRCPSGACWWTEPAGTGEGHNASCRRAPCHHGEWRALPQAEG